VVDFGAHTAEAIILDHFWAFFTLFGHGLLLGGRGQIYPDASKSNNTICNASKSGKITQIEPGEKKGSSNITIESSTGEWHKHHVQPCLARCPSKNKTCRKTSTLSSLNWLNRPETWAMLHVCLTSVVTGHRLPRLQATSLPAAVEAPDQERPGRGRTASRSPIIPPALQAAREEGLTAMRPSQVCLVSPLLLWVLLSGFVYAEI